MPDISPQLQNFLIQGGFAALFIWLLYRTQARQDAREDKLTATLAEFAGKMPEIARLLDAMEKRLERIEGENKNRKV